MSFIFSNTFYIMKYVLDLNIEDKNGWTPLHHAVRNSALNTIEFLLDNRVDDVRLNKQKEAVIHIAVIHNQIDALKVCRNILMSSFYFEMKR